MAAADFSQYVDLRVFDAQPGDIYLDSIEYAQLVLPEFNLRVGTPEDAMFQAMAFVSSLNIASINRIPDRLMGGIVAMMGFDRQDAIAAEVDITITLDNYGGGTIPAGTIFSYETVFEDEVQEYAFQTTSVITIDAVEDPDEETPFPSASATVVCLTPGIIPPIPTPGTELSVISAGTNIFSAETFANFSNGINEDTDFEYLSKAATYLRSLSSATNKASQLDGYLLSNYPELITRSKTYDLTNGDEDLGDVTTSRSIGIITTFLQDDLATVETSENHLFVVGDVVDIEDCGATFNGEQTITATSDTTFSFVKVAGNSASNSVTGSAYAGVDIAGYVTVFSYGRNTFLTAQEKTEIATDIANRSVAGLTFNVRDPELVTLELSGSIIIDAQFNETDVSDTIENALVNYLSPANFPYLESRIRKTTLISLITSIPGVVYVESLSMSGTGDGWLPQHTDDLLFLNKGTLPILSSDDIYFTYTSVTI
jgi:hypothetical protein